MRRSRRTGTGQEEPGVCSWEGKRGDDTGVFSLEEVGIGCFEICGVGVD